MHTFVVNDQVSGLLIPLAQLVERLPLTRNCLWRFHEITLAGRGFPFGMTFDEFEAATRIAPDGFEVSDEEFRVFLKSGIQIRDGEIEVWSEQFPITFVLRLVCEDSSQWEIVTEMPELANELEHAGFRRA